MDYWGLCVRARKEEADACGLEWAADAEVTLGGAIESRAVLSLAERSWRGCVRFCGFGTRVSR